MRWPIGAHTYNQLESIMRKTLLSLIIILAILIGNGASQLVEIIGPRLTPVELPPWQAGAVAGDEADHNTGTQEEPWESTQDNPQEVPLDNPWEPSMEVPVLAPPIVGPVEQPAIPATLPKDWGEILRNAPTAGKKIALTFDDGPQPFFTNAYLKILAEHQVPATFFVLGKLVEEHPQLARDIVEGGHELGGHSYRHQRLTTLSKQELLEDFRLVDNAFINAIGQKPLYYRPPYGAYDINTMAAGKKAEQLLVMWSIDPRDWESETHQDITKKVLERAAHGSIVVMHEGKKTTLEALPHIITGLKDRGYQFVTISQLIESAIETETATETAIETAIETPSTQ